MGDRDIPIEGQLSPQARERSQQPRNYGCLKSFDGHARITGPCGDTMEFWIRMNAAHIAEVQFTTTGCGPSRACGSMATELAIGKPPVEAACIEQADILAALGGLPEDSEHCALLAANTLKAAIEDLGNGKSCDSHACGTCSSTTCSSQQRRPNESDEDFQRRQALGRRMCQIGQKLLVLSGKGGVGKSTVAANLAGALAQAGKRVGLLDIDVHGPSIPRMMGVEKGLAKWNEDGILPVKISDNLAVMSIAFFLQSDREPVICRGPRKHGMIHQFLADVDWGPLDYLVVDSPPGTGDEPLSVAQLVGSPAGALIVTTPQDVAIADVRRCVTFCGEISLPILGIIENMSGFACPKCGETIDLFKRDGGVSLAQEMDLPLLGQIPIDPGIVVAGDTGESAFGNNGHTAIDKPFADIVASILANGS